MKVEFNKEQIIADIDEEKALAFLLYQGVMHLNNGFHPYSKKEYTTICFVNASDIFAWGCADSECILFEDGEDPSELIKLFKLVYEFGENGRIMWLCKKRNMQPQTPIKNDLIKDGFWFNWLENLPENLYEAKKKEFAEKK